MSKGDLSNITVDNIQEGDEFLVIFIFDSKTHMSNLYSVTKKKIDYNFIVNGLNFKHQQLNITTFYSKLWLHNPATFVLMKKEIIFQTNKF